MAPVCIKYIVSFSSQDTIHKVCNLLDSGGEKKWLSDPKDKSGTLEAIFQLDQPCHLAFIDIGLIWCATLEVRVGRSDWPQGKEYKALAPTQTLMSSTDCRLGRAVTRTCMLTKAQFHQEAAASEWDRVHVVCRQPWRKDVQLGLSFLRLRSDDAKIPGAIVAASKSPNVRQTVPQQSVESIKQHFFGKKQDSGIDRNDTLKSQLKKLVANSGGSDAASLPRVAHMVLTANQHSPRPAPPDALQSPKALYSSHVAQQGKPQIEQEMKDFLAKLEKKDLDLDKVKISDLRHKFEKQKWRKLTSEEKQTFFVFCQDFFADLYEGDITVNGEGEHISSRNFSAPAGSLQEFPGGSPVKQEVTGASACSTSQLASGLSCGKGAQTLSSSKKLQTSGKESENVPCVHQASNQPQNTDHKLSVPVKKEEVTSKDLHVSEKDSGSSAAKKRLVLSPPSMKRAVSKGVGNGKTYLEDSLLCSVSKTTELGVPVSTSNVRNSSDLWLNSRNQQVKTMSEISSRSCGRGGKGRGRGARGRQAASTPKPEAKKQEMSVSTDYSTRQKRSPKTCVFDLNSSDDSDASSGCNLFEECTPKPEAKKQKMSVSIDYSTRQKRSPKTCVFDQNSSDDSDASSGCDLFEECPFCEEKFPHDQIAVHMVHCC